jgi:hypothetical protein
MDKDGISDVVLVKRWLCNITGNDQQLQQAILSTSCQSHDEAINSESCLTDDLLRSVACLFPVPESLLHLLSILAINVDTNHAQQCKQPHNGRHVDYGSDMLSCPVLYSPCPDLLLQRVSTCFLDNTWKREG